MVTLAGMKFAENNNEFLETLFHKGTTCCGFAKRLKRQVNIYDMQHNIIGVVTHKLFLACADKRPELGGKVWYSYGTPEIFKDKDEKELYRDMATLSIGRDHKGYYFK